MLAAFVLIAGATLVLLIGAVVLAMTNTSHILPWLVPLAPWLVMVGTFLIILTEFLLFFGNKDDRRTARRDLCYLIPTCIISGGLWWLAQRYLW